MNGYRLWLLALILIGLGLRLALLGEQSLWYDEGVTWWLATMSPPALLRWTAADIQPPLYYLLLWAARFLLGSSEWALRFPSAAFGTLIIPLLYTLARRLFPLWPARRMAALFSAPYLAALLAAVSPLMVYYSQEARMYTLLVFEAGLGSYLLLRLLEGERSTEVKNGPWLAVIYTLVMVAGLYTHYFALFLLAAHGLYALVVLWRRGWPRPLLVRLAAAAALIVLLFAPWLPVLLSRLGDDPSYWPGALKLHEALRRVLISFSLGETMFEQTGLWLALTYLLPAGLWLLETVGLLPAGPSSGRTTAARRSPYPALFLLLWLLLPIGLILALSYQSPKFNARYTMLAWPAFALILADGLARLAVVPRPNPRPALAVFQLALFGFFGLFILVTSGFSLYNWFTDPRFAKDDFKALARFVQERIGPAETVLLRSGHMAPVWAYYYGWQGWTPLPDLPRLDVSRVIGLDITADLAPALQDQVGVWLVSWQEEVIDPNGVVPFWLDLAGRRPGDAGDFQGVRLEHWRLEPGQLARLQASPIERPAGFNFAGQVELVGMTQLNDTELALFWRPLQPLPDNLAMSLDLTDGDGFDWDRETLVGRPGAYLYPPSRWPLDQVTLTRTRLPWQPGAPPGRYVVEVGLGQVEQDQPAAFTGWDILDESGQPRRRTALLESLDLSRPAPFPPGSLAADQPPLLDFNPIISLKQMQLEPASAEPGDRLLLKLLWQAGEYNLDDLLLAFDRVDAAGARFRAGSSVTPSRRFNLPLWEPGQVVLGQYWLDIPPQAAPGPAKLELHLINSSGFVYDELFPLAELAVLPTERRFSLPDEVDLPLAADFSGLVSLAGVDCRPGGCAGLQVRPGQAITLTLYWRAETGQEINYTVFTHLLDAGEPVALNADHAPPKPSRGWVPGEIIADAVTLSIPPGLPPGEYRVEVGLYDAVHPDFRRLPLTGGETRLILPLEVVVK